MLDFEVQRFTRVCAITQRDLKAGDVFFSVLIRDGAEIVRQDVAADAWSGPPEECLAWWKAEVPDPKARKMHWAPHDVMLHYFADTEGKPEQLDVRYVLALLMIRRRIFRLEESESDQQGRATMIVFCPRNDQEYRIDVVEPTEERSREIQQLLSQLLVDAIGK